MSSPAIDVHIEYCHREMARRACVITRLRLLAEQAYVLGRLDGRQGIDRDNPLLAQIREAVTA